MFIKIALAHSASDQFNNNSLADMMQSMMGFGSAGVSFMRWFMMIGMVVFTFLVIVVLVLFIVWLVKQIKK